MAKTKRDKVKDILTRFSPENTMCLPLFVDEIMLLFEKKKKTDTEPCFQAMVDAWAEAYPFLMFRPIDGKCINEIISMTREVMTGRGKEATCEALVNSFKYVIAYVKREHHFCDGKPLTTWNSQYLSIVHEIANGKSKQKPLTTREKINQL
jgi:hypothetical protein